jgi:hypothetical protein
MMLVSAVSLMGAFIVSWSSSSFALKQLDIAKTVDDRVNQINEDYVIEDVWFFSNSTSKYAKVTLRNTGDVAANITNVYVNNTQAWSGGRLVSQESAQSITFESSWGSGKIQSIWVQTERGNGLKQVWKA